MIGKPRQALRALPKESYRTFVQFLVEGHNPPAAAEKAGFVSGSHTYLMRRPDIRAAIAEQVDSVIRTEAVGLATSTLIELMKPGNPANVRLGAAQLTFKAAGMLDRHADNGARPLSEMTADELEDAIRKMDERMAEIAQEAKPVGKADEA